jgi:peptidoglycan/xylan/chitin deacetylase (PgdA/CDA1 family)
MEIGCHGMHHRQWRRLDQSGLHEELVEARAILEHTAEQPITQAACPFGSYDRGVLHALRRFGYRHAFTSDGGVARPGDFLQARNSVRPHEDAPGLLEQFSERDTGRSTAVRRRVKLAVKRWR